MSGNLIWAIIAFGIMIFGHELGHFLVAKRVGITVQAFALGFGPKLVGVTRGETLYAINLVPFGGYVKLAGEDLQEGGGPNTFRAKSVWQRMAVLAAGPMMNLLLALTLLAGLALVLGVPSGVTNRIGQVLTDCFDAGHRVPCPAKQAGLQDGDGIVAIKGRPGAGALLAALGALLVRPREGLGSVMGPIGAVQFLGETARGGGEIFLYTAAAMSVLIGVFNLLPIPALDGGRLFFLAVEAVWRRPIDPRREGYIHMVGFVLLILLLLTLSVRDVSKILHL